MGGDALACVGTRSAGAGVADGSPVNAKTEEGVDLRGNGGGPDEATAATPVAEGVDFLDPQDSISTASNTEMDDGNGPERSWKPPGTPMAEYYDAFEEILSEGAAQSSSQYTETELHEMRLNLLMEIERRKQAEGALGNLHGLWRRMSHQLSLVGLMLPSSATFITESKDGAPSDVDPIEELGQQGLISQLVVESVCRGFSRAEVELEMEPQVNAKNFEIARLRDRLQYYEASNREMSQRNQEAVEMARQQRNRRKRRQKWIWRSAGLAIAIGTAAVVWSYLSLSSSSSSEGKREGIRKLD